MNTVTLTEFVRGGNPRVDRAAGAIRNVKVLGWESSNGRKYLPEGVNPALYEGKAVNVNHTGRPGESRSAYDRFGRLVNIEKRADGLFGVLEYLKSHPLANAIIEAAERMPDLFGLSHNARGRERRGGAGVVIEAVESVLSVDVVADPATTRGLFESQYRLLEQAAVAATDEDTACRARTLMAQLNALINSLRDKKEPLTSVGVDVLAAIGRFLDDLAGDEPPVGESRVYRREFARLVRGGSSTEQSIRAKRFADSVKERPRGRVTLVPRRQTDGTFALVESRDSDGANNGGGSYRQFLKAIRKP